jgi:hypothetical protein
LINPSKNDVAANGLEFHYEAPTGRQQSTANSLTTDGKRSAPIVRAISPGRAHVQGGYAFRIERKQFFRSG